ncbi:MAG: UbiA prenyltransferase family protein [Candidatus Cloacimonetes bacterium]|nr:UbiA prenyltransferase family protein [Candidatus Cloacimonadota bacterium]
MQKYVKLLRVKHYIKNLFVFLPLFFAGKLFDQTALLQAAWSFLSFCLIASSVYIVNDYVDMENDKIHPVKCKRPFASGDVPLSQGFILWLLLWLASFLLAYDISKNTFCVIVAYKLMNLCYSFYLKKLPIIDISIVSLGFVFRLFVGGYATGVELSEWIILMTFLFALFVAIAKRRDDVLMMEKGTQVREAISGYNLKFVDLTMVMIGGVIIVCYIMYSLTPSVQVRMGGRSLYFTTYFVILAVLRYMQLAFVENRTGSPTALAYSDRFLQLTLLAWIVTFIWLIYL